MKYPFILKLLIVLLTLLCAWTYFVIAAVFYGPTGLFNLPNTFHEQIVGRILIAMAVIMIISSLLIFRKNNLGYLIILLGTGIAALISFGTVQHLEAGLVLPHGIYVILVIVLYVGSRRLEQKHAQSGEINT